MESMNLYKKFPNARWTLTKTDETRSPAASVFSVPQAELPISYMTNGQSETPTHLNATLC